MVYRLFLDECGNSGFGTSANPSDRYLGLTGVIIDLEYAEAHVFPILEELKRRYFGSTDMRPVILPWKELSQANYPFQSLRDPNTRTAFEAELVALMSSSYYVVATAIIDKHEHKDRYGTLAFDPYHYCLEIILERFVLWLQRCDAQGDIMAEARGGKADERLKQVYRDLYGSGTRFLPIRKVQDRLTSRELKVKPKVQNVLGLQLADLIAHPSFRAALAQKEVATLTSGLTQQIVTILESSKYDRDSKGCLEGWGRKWLP